MLLKRTVVCALGAFLWGCADEAPAPSNLKQQNQNIERAATPRIEGTRADNYTFDIHETFVSATVRPLADVRVHIDGDLEIFPTVGFYPNGTKATEDWRYRLSAPKIGRVENELISGTPQFTTLNGHTVTTGFETWAVDYTHRSDGLEQIIRIQSKPQGSGDTFTVGFDSAAEFVHERDELGAIRVTKDGNELFSWRKLNVFDATGKSLIARMDVDNGKLRYIVNDKDALYPVTIDPLAQSPSFSEIGSQDGAELGRVAFAGDVNNDGFDDVLIGERRFDSAFSNEGRAMLFSGSANGISATAIWTVLGGSVAANFGNELAALGDVNGDGVDDFAVGATNAGANFVGGAYVFLGGNNVAPSTTAIFSQFGVEVGESFGDAIAAGDFNCDGRKDLAVGAANWDAPGPIAAHGRVVIFHGIAASPFFDAGTTTNIERTDLGSFYGRSLAVGNVNGDSVAANECDDLIVGGARYSTGFPRQGRADLYLGSAAGINPNTIAWTVLGGATDQRYGFSVDSGVDVNGDGNDEILVGGYGAEIIDGRVDMYLGASTPSTTPAWTATGGQATASFAFSVAFAGDVDNNGFEDILVGAPEFVFSGNNKVGAAFLYAASSSIPPTTPTWTETEGGQADQNYGFEVDGNADVNNDGFADVIVGSSLFDNLALTNAGAAYAYLGQGSCTVGGTVYSDGDANPSNPCEACDTSLSTTSFSPVGNGNACNDGNQCTENDVCSNGTCAGVARVCNDNDPCTADSCDPLTGCLFDGPAADGNVCADDGLACTNDVCAGGVCTHPIDADDCLIGGDCFATGEALPVQPCEQCVPGTSQTAFTPAASGATCEDGAFCTVNDTCDGAGVCTGSARDCSSALTECTMNTSCDDLTDQCVAIDPVANGTACDAADLCNAGSCSFGVCIPGAPVDCSAFDSACAVGSCDPGTGTCFGDVVADGTACDPGDACQIGGTCTAGVCSGTARDCNDNNECTLDACDSVNGCVNTDLPNGSLCTDNDGLACTNGACNFGSCLPSLNQASCLINMACFADGDPDGQNVCRVCDSANDTTDFSNAAAGTSCGSDTCLGDQLAISECTGLGSCAARFVDCGAYTCDTNNSECFTTCLTTAECETGAGCTSDGVTPGECVTDKPTAVIDGPVIADCGEEVTLDGSNSSDPNNRLLQYSWTQTDGPTVLLAVSDDGSSVTFTVPEDLSADTNFVFQLVVSNNAFDSDPSTWIVAVEACNTGEDMGNSDMGNNDVGGDFGSDIGNDSGNDVGLDVGSDVRQDVGGDVTNDTTNDTTSEGEVIVRGSGCLCTTTSNYPTDVSWLLLIGLIGWGRRRRR